MRSCLGRPALDFQASYLKVWSTCARRQLRANGRCQSRRSRWGGGSDGRRTNGDAASCRSAVADQRRRDQPASAVLRGSIAVVFAVLIVLLAASYLLFGKDSARGPNQIALIFSGVVAGVIAHKNGMPWQGVSQAVVDGVSTGLVARSSFCCRSAP